jgi:hypothetical protein
MGLHETLLLENPSAGRYTLTRVLTLANGLQARLQAEGTNPGELLACVEAVPAARQIQTGPGFVLVQSHHLDAKSGVPLGDALPPLRLTQGALQLDGLTLNMRVSPVQGIAAELQLAAPAADAIDLPEDLLAVLGWPWTRLTRVRDGWKCTLRLRGSAAARSRDAEAKLQRTAQHLAQTLAEPPLRFHQRQFKARWGVTLRRATPLLLSVGLFAAAAAVSRIDLATDSVFRMLIFHSPPLLLVALFCMPEMPRIEIPPWPRASAAPGWRLTSPAGTQPG